MGGKPATIYSDSEGAFISTVIQTYFKDNDIRCIISQGHAAYAERAIRTIKDMIYNRLKLNQPWHEVVYAVLLTYNHKMVSRVTKHTPVEAMKATNHVNVKINLEMHRLHSRKYPEISVGNKVKVFKKKDKMDKQQKSTWSPNHYFVESISESMGQKFYKLNGISRPFMRNEILLIT